MLKEVARAIGVTATHVYLMKHRVSAALKKEMAQVEREGTRLDQILPANQPNTSVE